MTARSKVTLVEAQQIRSKIINTVTPYGPTDEDVRYIEVVIDALLTLGLIDTDAALRLVASET